MAPISKYLKHRYKFLFKDYDNCVGWKLVVTLALCCEQICGEHEIKPGESERGKEKVNGGLRNVSVSY